jgi:ubiquinone/menaquinone biosynthesis C-methylase UbiE
MAEQEQTQLEQRKRGIAGVFSRSAPTYDNVGPRFFSHFGQRLVELAEIPAGAHVLDVAAGRGAILFPASERVGSTGRVVGIDIAGGMIDQMKAQIARRGLKQAEAYVMDAEQLDFPDASFNYVLCGFGVFFFPQFQRALAEFSRVLVPGGHLVLSTWGADDNRWKWMEQVTKKYAPPTDSRPQSFAGSNADFKTPDGMKAIMTAAGFVDFQVIPEDAEFWYSDEKEWLTVAWSHGQRYVLEVLPPEAFDQWKQEMFENLRAMKRGEGIPHRFYALFTLARNP